MASASPQHLLDEIIAFEQREAAELGGRIQRQNAGFHGLSL
jgi:hypothetical protein